MMAFLPLPRALQLISFPHDHVSNIQSASNFAKLIHARLQTSFPMQELDITLFSPLFWTSTCSADMHGLLLLTHMFQISRRPMLL